MRFLGLLVAVVAAGFVPAAALAHPHESVTGQVRVIDGDTIDMRTQDNEIVRVRLWGLDAPEKAQGCKGPDSRDYACGDASRAWLQALVAGKAVTCEKRGKPSYDRMVAECFIGSQSINEALVRNGMAIAYRQYSTKFVTAEAHATAERAGMWAGRFQKPECFRRKESGCMLGVGQL